MARRRFRSTPSHIYQRLLWGEVTAERYVAVIKRASRMRLTTDLEREVARRLADRRPCTCSATLIPGQRMRVDKSHCPRHAEREVA